MLYIEFDKKGSPISYGFGDAEKITKMLNDGKVVGVFNDTADIIHALQCLNDEHVQMG